MKEEMVERIIEIVKESVDLSLDSSINLRRELLEGGEECPPINSKPNW